MTPPIRSTEHVSATEPSTATTVSPASPNPTPPESSTAESSSTETGWNFAGRLAFSPGAVNGRNGEILAADWFGRLGDYRHFQVAAALLYDLTDGDVRLRVGPELSFDMLSGDHSAAGSSTYHITAGANFEIDWRRLWGRSPVAGPSRIGVDLGIGYGFGTTQAETISLHQQSGVAYALGASLNLANVSVGPVEVGLDAYIRWNTVDGAVFNSPTFAVGGALTFRGAVEPAPTVEVVECSEDRRARLEAAHTRLTEQISELRAGNIRHQEILNVLQARLEARGITRETLVENLRSAYVEVLLAQREENVGELAGVEDDAAAQTQAVEAAAARYSDDFDPYAMPEVAATPVPDPLPEDCDELDLYIQQLNDEVAQLNYQKGVMEGTVTGLLIRLGAPPSDAGNISRLITQFRDIHFITARPYGGPDAPPAAVRRLERTAERRGHQVYLTIEEITQAVDTYLTGTTVGEDGLRAPMPMDQAMSIFASTFPASLRPPAAGSTTPGEAFNPALETVTALAQLLRSRDMRREGTFVLIRGHTDSRGADDYNMRLSQRRADALAQALRASGVEGERIRTAAFGETEPINYFDQLGGGAHEPHRLTTAERQMLAEAGVTGRALTDEVLGRDVTNRRVEVYICMPNTEEPHCVAVASIPEEATTDPTAGAPIVQAVDTPRIESSAEGTVPAVTTSTTDLPPPARGRRRPHETPPAHTEEARSSEGEDPILRDLGRTDGTTGE